MNYLLTNYFEQSDFREGHIAKQGQSLQEYIDKNHISSTDLSLLEKWEYRQPIILLELYAGNDCIYSSLYDDPKARISLSDIAAEDDSNSVSIELTDINATAILYSDFTYQYYLLGTALSVILSLVLFVLLFLRSNNKLIRYICRLNEEVQILEGGNLEYRVSVEGNDEITDLARSMNRMRQAFRQQMETEQTLHQTNRQLITEMSHDLRTPLTGILLYLEILKSHRYTTEAEQKDYLDKIDAKARHMKVISDHLFAYSLEETVEKQLELQSMEKAFTGVIQCFSEDLKARGFSTAPEPAWIPCRVRVNSEFIQRIFENITSNIIRYATPSTEVRIDLIETEAYCGFSVMNACTPSNIHPDSRGIGIESIHRMMRQMNGLCTVEQTETAFEISLFFPRL
ncbi:MAG: HAMP domain-containing histidine kinase [Firmicutes bacterium]|nr:HAMP domain-containing histidine kinase [Bacillota bacterium]